MLHANTGKARISGKDINVPAPPEVPAYHSMVYANTSKARISGKDINVPAPPEVPACAGELGVAVAQIKRTRVAICT